MQARHDEAQMPVRLISREAEIAELGAEPPVLHGVDARYMLTQVRPGPAQVARQTCERAA